jgi:hypothetical protein
VIQLIKGTTANVILTLTEKQLISAPNYLFVFTNRTTNYDVKFILVNAKDLSLYKERFNKFSIKVDSYFSNKLNGQWDYSVYEQTSSQNTDVTGLNLLESGVMILSEAETIYTEYSPSDKFKIRQ